MAKRLRVLNRRKRRAIERPRHYCEFEYRPYWNWDENDPHYSLTKKQCGLEGMACYLPDDWFDGKVTEYLCAEHREMEGYCVGCGTFCAGIESFDFGTYRGFCDNCASELEADDRRWDEDYYDYDYDNYDEYDEFEEA